MTPLDAALASWPARPWLAAGLLAAGVVYARGWRCYHRSHPVRWPPARLISFLAGLTVIYLALASPIEPFATFLLSVHMVQHLLLMMVAPPLFWLSAPFLPMVRGLPGSIRNAWVAPLLQIAWLRRTLSTLARPVPALFVLLTVTWAWHAPALYELALGSEPWHYVQHACFLTGGLLFWFGIVRPHPYRPDWPVWLLLPCLVVADASNTVLSALFTFSEQALYPHYAMMPAIAGTSALDDQAAAGVIMWAPGSFAYLLPMAAISLNLLFGEPTLPLTAARKRTIQPQRGRIPLPLATIPAPTSTRFDLLRTPVVGRFLRWRRARLALQLVAFAIAAAVVMDGLFGPDVAAMNLAGVLVWVVWRGALVLALATTGNFFCTACPFMLPRALGRKFLPTGIPWPRSIAGKWPAIGLLVIFFTAYEAFSLWDRPRLTAWIVIGYFAAAFAVDGLFRGASFCKHLCPIGQFNFVQSLTSPIEVDIRDPSVCASCRTHDCIRGGARARGCEMGLYLPRKNGNLDCTFCLDCVHACPHDNVGLLSTAPGDGLTHDPPRAGIGRLSQRPDVAALVVLLVFAAFANAAGMVAPVVDWEADMVHVLGLDSRRPLVVALSLVALIAAPIVLVGVAAWASRILGRLNLSVTRTASRFAVALAPVGLGMWTAHYGYHLATGWDALWPVVQRGAADLGWSGLGDPQWSACCCVRVAAWVARVELLALDLGFLLSLYLAYHTARDLVPRGRSAATFLPWAMLVGALFAAGVWIVLQPMEMRGASRLAGSP